MKIGIDVNCLLFDHSGIGHYTRNLVENLLLIDKSNQYFLYADNFLRKRAERQAELAALVDHTHGRGKIVVLPLPPKIKEFLLGTPYPLKNLIRQDLDVYFAPHFTGIAQNGFTKTVVTVHDVIFLKHPEYWAGNLGRYYARRVKIAVQNAKKIIVDSEATKKDLIELLNVPENKIKVVYLGSSDKFKSFNRITEKDIILQKTSQYLDPRYQYILSVGTIEPRKNFEAIVRAFALLPLQIKNRYRIALIGSNGWKNEALSQIIYDSNLKEKVVFPGFIPDTDLPYIYNRADVFVYPSLAEGFGLPVLEAMASGLPVITSNNSSLPEVVEKAGLLVNPQDEKEIAAALKTLILKPKLAQKLSRLGLEQAKKFSWEKTAKQTLKILEETAKK